MPTLGTSLRFDTAEDVSQIAGKGELVRAQSFASGWSAIRKWALILHCCKVAITGQSLPIFHSVGLEFAYFGEYFCESVGEPIKAIAHLADW